MNRTYAVAIGVVAAIALSGLIGGYTALQLSGPPATAPTGATVAPQHSAANTSVNETVYRQAYSALMDSVVSIKVRTRYGDTSQGTGFVYDHNGHIVTNHHVVDEATVVEIQFRDGTWQTAEIVGADVYSDLAVLKVDALPPRADPLPVADMNPSPGSVVMALGNPFGLQETITHGIVSGVNRTMETAGGFSIPATVQTDTPINPGNSGGPLINTDGLVVGVNRAKQGDNIGFAISPAIINRVVPALIRDGEYQHPYLGARMAAISPTVAEVNGLDSTDGVLVVETADGSPSDSVLRGSQMRAYTRTGTVPIGGDIIHAVDGRTVDAPKDVNSYIATQTAPGDTVTFTVLRDGEQQTVSAALEERPQPRYRGTGIYGR